MPGSRRAFLFRRRIVSSYAARVGREACSEFVIKDYRRAAPLRLQAGKDGRVR
jgi:hypothetical protein